VGRIIKVRPHPYGDRIWLADVEIGPDHQAQIVWGGVPLLDEGDLVPVAPPGSRLPQGKMRRRRYRGEVSEGMLCSLAELGWDLSVSDRVALLDEHAGVIVGDSLDPWESNWPSIIRPDQLPRNETAGAAEAMRVQWIRFPKLGQTCLSQQPASDSAR
jgi:tRNA-binding EMAP/Myf-like protein